MEDREFMSEKEKMVVDTIEKPVFRRSTMNLPAHFHHFLTAGFYNLQI